MRKINGKLFLYELKKTFLLPSIWAGLCVLLNFIDLLFFRVEEGTGISDYERWAHSFLYIFYAIVMGVFTARNPKKDKTPCIMFARNAKAVLDTIANCKTRQSKKDANGNWKSIRIQTIEKVYSSLHYLPLDGFGARLLKIITQPNHVKRILRAVYQANEIAEGGRMFEYDGIIEDTVYSLCHLDGDIRRLIAFCNGLEVHKEKGEILCYEFQREYVEEYVKGKNIEVFTVSLEEVERVLDLSV